MQRSNQSTRRGISFLTGAAVLASVAFIGTSPAAAQEGVPEGFECVRFDIAPSPDVFVPGGHDIAVLVMADGTEALFVDVADNQRLESPSDSPIVALFKCDITETVVAPEPEPTAVPEPTPAPEPTTEPTPAPEPTPTSAPEPTAEPTPAPEATPTTQANPAPDTQATPTPDVEVLGSSVVRDSLPVTGSGSAELALVAAAFIGVGLMLRRFQTGLATR